MRKHYSIIPRNTPGISTFTSIQSISALDLTLSLCKIVYHFISRWAGPVDIASQVAVSLQPTVNAFDEV